MSGLDKEAFSVSRMNSEAKVALPLVLLASLRPFHGASRPIKLLAFLPLLYMCFCSASSAS
eukprot:2421387-Karenia_brevis.AAC.1